MATVAFVGLDDLSLALAAALLRAGFRVRAFSSVNGEFMRAVVDLGGVQCASPREAAEDATTVIVLASREEMTEVLFGEEGVAKGFSKDAVVINRSTLSPSHVSKLEKSLRDVGGVLVDTHIFRGFSEALKEKFIVVASGGKDAIKKAQPVISAVSENVYVIEGEAGEASKVRMVIELLQGVHLVASVEAMFLGVRAGIHPSVLYEIISNAAGSSWIFVDTVPKLLISDDTLIGSLCTLVNNLGLVFDVAKSLKFPLPLLGVAYQQLIFGTSCKYGEDLSAAPLKVWEQTFGVNIGSAANQKSYNPEQLAEKVALTSVVVKRIGFIGLGAMGFGMATHLLQSNFSVIAYDVYEPALSRFADLGGFIGGSPGEVSKDVDVLILMVANEVQAESVLCGDTGALSALPEGASIILSSTVSPAFTTRLEQLLKGTNKGLKLVDAPVSGGVKRAADGTLSIMASGTDEALACTGTVLSALSEKLYIIRGGCGAASSVKMVNQLLAGVHIAAAAEAMAFGARLGLDTRMLFEIVNHGRGYSWMFGNRVPHMLDNDYTPYSAVDIFVKDLGIVCNEGSNLKIPLHVSTIALQLFLSGSAAGFGRFDDAAVVKGSTCIVNAASDRDMAVFAAGMIQAEAKGKRFLCRTAASFVSARIGIKAKPPISPSDLGITKDITGGLIVVGSYVPKSTKQVEQLKSRFGHLIKCIEVPVDKLSMMSAEVREETIQSAAEIANVSLSSHKDTLLLTSRELLTGKSPSESLEINYKVSSAIVEIVRRIRTRPRYILAKGGITSSDIATKALEARRAKVIGQALAGVPLWLLGPESRHPGVPYIVFPGNVGDNNALAEVVKNWSRPPRSGAKDLLLNAEHGGYAIGAFNVYNLEGVEAVIGAAEAENSPAILQIHPGALKHGGHCLVKCCIFAAEQARVPIIVHFDHGNSKPELLEALEMGFDSVMVDGSHFPLKENISFTKYMTDLAHKTGMLVEAELGRLSGTEDDLTVEDYEARLTDVTQAKEFIEETGVDALAVCIGNVHGTYPAAGPKLRLDLLKDLRALTLNKGVSLVLHGASGLSKELIQECIDLGVRKFNVNTEVRNAYLESLKNPGKDLVHQMASAKEAMKAVVAGKMRLFGSAGKA